MLSKVEDPLGFARYGKLYVPDDVSKQITREELAALVAEAPTEEDEEPTPDWALPAPSVPVFPIQALDRLLQRLDPEKERRLHTPAKLATVDRGYRQIPRWPGLSEHLHSLRSEFPNFSDVLGSLECELALASVLPPEEFHVPAMLLHGAPGIGKTRMAKQLAEALDLPFAKITASGSQGGFTLVGTSSH